MAEQIEMLFGYNLGWEACVTWGCTLTQPDEYSAALQKLLN